MCCLRGSGSCSQLFNKAVKFVGRTSFTDEIVMFQ